MQQSAALVGRNWGLGGIWSSELAPHRSFVLKKINKIKSEFSFLPILWPFASDKRSSIDIIVVFSISHCFSENILLVKSSEKVLN